MAETDERLLPIRLGDLVNKLIDRSQGSLSLALLTLVQHMGETIILIPESWDIGGGTVEKELPV